MICLVNCVDCSVLCLNVLFGNHGMTYVESKGGNSVGDVDPEWKCGRGVAVEDL